MLISDKHKFIFIKPARTAGSTMQHLLAPYANLVPQQHTTAAECAYKYPKEWKEYKKIATCRNPYDRIVSHYFRRFEYGVFTGSLSEFIQEIKNRWTVYGMTQVNGKVDIDIWVKFEQIPESIDYAFHALGLPLPTDIPVLKKSTKDHPHRHYLEKRDYKIINSRFREDIALAKQLGYSI